MKLLRELHEEFTPDKHKGLIPISRQARYAVWHNEYVKKTMKKSKKKRTAE